VISLNFSMAELCITDDPIPISVADKLLKHIRIIQSIRDRIGVPISASQHSGYRPVAYELAQGRSGNSEHTFHGEGAVDWTCRKSHIATLFEELKESEYRRVAFYPHKNFVHCDLKGAEKLFFIADTVTNKWKREDGNS